MHKALPVLLIFLLLEGVSVLGQQPASPLEASFKQYIEMKKATLFGLEWINLGPVVNSARVEAVQRWTQLWSGRRRGRSRSP